MSDTPLFTAEEPASGPTETPTGDADRHSGRVQQVLYRKWRPQSFAEVAGQDAVTRTLRNSVAANSLAHAYLFCGPRGTGKTTLGRLLAKAANCDAPVEGEPCNACPSCTAFNEGRAMDFIEQDAASHNSVDDIRTLRENVVLTPMAGRRKVYLLDEVHMLSTAAQNALLKTLEEPPPHIIFVLATTESHKVAATISSRCQRFDLKRIPLRAVVDRLGHICREEGFTFSPESLEEIARAATGSLRDGINALEQVVTYYGPSPDDEQVKDALGINIDARSGQFVMKAMQKDLPAALGLIAAVRDDGVDIREFTKQAVQYLRGLLFAQAGITSSIGLPADMVEEVKREASSVDRGAVLNALRAFGSIEWNKDREFASESLPLELALIDLCQSAAQVAATPAASPTPVLAPEPAPPKPEPTFRVARAETNAVETTVNATVLETPATEAAPADAPPPTPRQDDDVLAKVRAVLTPQDKTLAALLNGSCEIASMEDGRVVLGFYHTFHLERIESLNSKKAVEVAFSTVLGAETSVAYEHRPRGPEAERPQEAGGHLVQAAREKHGARAVPQDE